MNNISKIAAALAAGTLAVSGAAAAHPDTHHDNGKHLGWYKHKHKTVRTVRVIRRAPVRRVVVYETGQYLPRDYYVNRTYYVQPTVYGLAAAPPGYEWVRVGNNVYLTQTNTGLIANVVANLFR